MKCELLLEGKLESTDWRDIWNCLSPRPKNASSCLFPVAPQTMNPNNRFLHSARLRTYRYTVPSSTFNSLSWPMTRTATEASSQRRGDMLGAV